MLCVFWIAQDIKGCIDFERFQAERGRTHLSKLGVEEGCFIVHHELLDGALGALPCNFFLEGVIRLSISGNIGTYAERGSCCKKLFLGWFFFFLFL